MIKKIFASYENIDIYIEMCYTEMGVKSFRNSR